MLLYIRKLFFLQITAINNVPKINNILKLPTVTGMFQGFTAWVTEHDRFIWGAVMVICARHKQ
jgi:hypothetical protein